MALSYAKGQAAELRAKLFLEKNALKHIMSNFHSRFGEIDLIMIQDDVLVFIEVRARRSDAYGSALESIHWAKQQKIIKTAQYFLLTHAQYQKYYLRFDVVALQGNSLSINWIRNAFA